MKICNECKQQFDTTFRNCNSKYCGDECRRIVRKRVQAADRAKRKERMYSDDIDFICNDIFLRYKQGSPKRSYCFELTIDDFKQFFRQPCTYCGDAMENVGFDRINNLIGYTRDNITPCCSICNRMKHSHSIKDFIKQCKKIAKNNV